jgi:hypothetical protein
VERTSDGVENTTWPKAGKTEKPLAKGGGEVVAKIAATPSSIGYANLADARGTFGKAPSRPGTEKFWAEVENTGTTTTSPLYQDPATNGDAEAIANSNCEKEKYTNGSGTKFPPETTAKTWDTVTTATKEPKYPICGITYDMALSSYSTYPSTSSGEAIAVHDYLQFVDDTALEGGQPSIVGHDYEKLPASLLDIAQDGADLIKN